MSIKQIFTTIKNLKSDKDLQNFLIGILTPEEVNQINKRIKIVQMIKKGIPQHQIAEKLGVGIATVTRGSRMLKEGRFDNV
jgi:TrpR family transcriptional regulator, trp operon repressor